MVIRPWRDLDGDVFRFTTTDLRELHLGLMTAFERAVVLAPVLGIDDVQRALRAVGWDEPVPLEQLTGALGSLVGWGLLEVSQDHTASYATPEEFERRNLQWSLAPRGEAAITGVLAALDALRHTVSLQPAVLDAIGDGLVEVASLLANGSSADVDAQIHLRLAEIESHLAGLVTSVRQFNGQLQRLVRSGGDADDEAELFTEVKRRTVSYLQDLVQGVDRPRRRIETVMRELEPRTASLFDRAAQGANLAPVLGGDPTPQWVAERHRRWDALASWFAPVDAEPPRVAGLIKVARAAIIELLRVLERRWDERRRSASVARDLRALAGHFRSAEHDEEAHRLFHAAFGIWSARHAHLLAEDVEPRQPRRSFGQADPVEVAPSLRTSGTLAQRGRSRPVASAERFRTRRARDEVERLAADHRVRERLATGSTLRLADLPDLDPVEFRELLILLGQALDSAPGSDEARRALSVDGQVEIALWPDDGRAARLRTTDGVLTAPNFAISIELVGLAEPVDPVDDRRSDPNPGSGALAASVAS